MWFQPLIYFSAVLWAAFFLLFGIFLAVRRAPTPLFDRVAGFFAAVLIGGIGAGAIIGLFYLVQELI